MSQHRNLDAGASGQLDAIPMQKAKPGVIAAIAGGAILVVGALVWASTSGGKDEAKAAELKARAAQATQKQKQGGLSAKEQREHLQTTQRALAAFEAAKKEKAEQTKSEVEQSPRPVAAAPRHAAAPARAPSQPQPVAKPKPKNTARAKKQLDGLDSIGDSITSALK